MLKRRTSNNNNNPFIETDDTDVVLKVEGHTLYTHSGILCTHSLVFTETLKDMVDNKTLELKGKNVNDVITFLKCLYPNQQEDMNEHTNFDELLSLCQEYQVGWLTTDIESFMIASKMYQKESYEYSVGLIIADRYYLKRFKTQLEETVISLKRPFFSFKVDSIDREKLFMARHFNLSKVKEMVEKDFISIMSGGFDGEKEAIKCLVLAEQHNLVKLKKKILQNKISVPFNEMLTIEGFNTLDEETIYHLAKGRLNRVNSTQVEEMTEIIKVLDQLYFNNKENNKSTILDYTDVAIHEKDEELELEASLENPFSDSTTTDVVVIVEDHKLHIHSTVLCYNSPVFKAMLQGYFREAHSKRIELREKKAIYVIELFEHFYGYKGKTLNAHTNFKELLSLCREYQVNWLTNKIEEYLLKSKIFRVNNIVTGLWLAEIFKLDSLKSKIIEQNTESISKLVKNDKFDSLKATTRYKLTKREIIFRIQEVEPKYETLISFLDGLFQ